MWRYGVVDQGLHTMLLQMRLQKVSVSTAHYKKMPHMLLGILDPVLAAARQSNQGIADTGEIALCNLSPGIGILIKASQFDSQQRCLQFIQPAIDALISILVLF